jgi:hypothetical protein
MMMLNGPAGDFSILQRLMERQDCYRMWHNGRAGLSSANSPLKPAARIED